MAYYAPTTIWFHTSLIAMLQFHYLWPWPEIYHLQTSENTVHNFFLPVQWTVFKQSSRNDPGLLFFLLFAKNNNDLYCYAVSSKFSHLCSTCKRASYPIDDYLLHNFKIMKPPRTNMQNLDDPWPLVCTKSSDARDVVGLVGGAYALLTFLRKKMAAYIMVGSRL